MDGMNPAPQTPPSSAPQSAGVVPAAPSKKDGSVGPVLAIVVIVALLALGGWYYFTQVEGNLGSEDQQAVENLETQGTSDDLSAIEADVEATDFSSLDSASSDVNADFEGQ